MLNGTSRDGRRSLVEALENRTLLSAGSLDTTFGVKGKVAVPGVVGDSNSAAAIQKDGKILVGTSVGASKTDAQLTRFTAAGKLDTTFSTKGKLLFDFTDEDSISALAVQPDGKILVLVKSDEDTGETVRLVRLLPTGAEDKTFGTGGTRVLGQNVYYRKLILPGTGKILVCDSQGTMTRLLTNGTVDKSFGNDGVLEAPQIEVPAIPGVASTSSGGGPGPFLYRASDKKIFSVATLNYTGYDDTGSQVAEGHEAYIYRYTAAGDLDSSFGTNGKFTLDLSAIFKASLNWVYSSDVALLPNGKIAWCGDIATDGGDQRYFVVRLTAAGQLDRTFASSGVFWPSYDTERLTPTSDNGLALAMTIDKAAGDDVVIGRLTATGQWAAKFGTSGRTTLNLGADDYPEMVLAQPNGDLIVVGISEKRVSGKWVSSVYLARLTAK